MDYKKIADMIYDSTYIQNVNTGQVIPPNYLGASSNAGVVARTNPLYNGTNTPAQNNPLYNNPNTLHADMTLSQSNPYNPKQAKVI
jgi:hypothetical protein|tara:strand:+ start:140 stop:397 length:258 start_codon:yes stop_codon:yes gene_type:complete